MFEGIDLTKLFDTDSNYGKRYIFPPVTDALIRRAEEKLGYRIPASYRALLRFQNGGTVSDALDESWLTAIYGIGPEPDTEHGLEEMFDNWRDEWEYPDIGIPFGETQSGGHDMYYMDCREIGADGEPPIVRVDVEDMDDIRIYSVAENLPAFIRLILANEEIEETLLEELES
jgi:hypothetical protein